MSGIRRASKRHWRLRKISGPTAVKTIFSAWSLLYLVEMAKAHSFNDANKRTSISCALMFLGGNGIQIGVTDDDLVFHTVRAARCRQADRDQEVDSIALWLQLAALRR